MTLRLWTVVDETWPSEKARALLLEWEGDEYPRMGERRVVKLWKKETAVYVDGFGAGDRAQATYWVRTEVVDPQRAKTQALIDRNNELQTINDALRAELARLKGEQG